MRYEFSYRADLDDPVSVLTSEKRTYFVNETIHLSAFTSSDDQGIISYMFHVNDENSTLWLMSPNWTLVHNTTGNITVKVSVMDISGRISRSPSGDPRRARSICMLGSGRPAGIFGNGAARRMSCSAARWMMPPARLSTR